MSDSAVSSALRYYATADAALFPMPTGQKIPTGIVESFAHDCSTDPAVWTQWAAANPGCNWGIVAGPSRLIIVDVDVSEVGRDRAWSLWCEWCAAAGVAALSPHVQSARGGWHYYFRLPDDTPALRQVALVGPTNGSKKAVIDLRVGNGFTVAAGSYYDGTLKGEASGPYVLLSNAAPYPAPAALITHCTRAAPGERTSKPGERDRNDVAALVTWISDRDLVDAYDDWVSLGMALKLEFGDDGFELWEIATWPHALDAARAKWSSFADEPTGNSVTLSSWLDRAHKAGWRGAVRRSAASMFGDAGQVAALAAAAGATLPPPVGGLPMLAGQEVLTDLGRPTLDDFLTTTRDAPSQPLASDSPTLPESVSGHGLFEPLRESIARALAMAENPRTFKPTSVVHMLGVLRLVHPDTYDAVIRRFASLGVTVPEAKVKHSSNALEDRVKRRFHEQAEWVCHPRTGEIENDNSDNVIVMLGRWSLELRHNVWLARDEIRGGSEPELMFTEWTRIDDVIIAKMRTRGNRTGTRFRPTKDFLTDTLASLAQENKHDPVVECISRLEDAWDGTPRLSIWLSRTCGVPCDLYHQAVSRNIVGGIVRRARHPGCKHDETAILIGPQGNRKSTLCRILAMRDDWFSDSVSFDGSPQNVIPQLFGKLVIELAELDGMARREVQHVKRFLSAQVDSVTLKYRAFATDFARRCVFIGTSNEDAPLMDSTGNRRFLPVRVNAEIDTDWLLENIEQIVGEAAVRESKGEGFGIPREIWTIAAEHQNAARAETDIETRLHDWFAPTEMTAALSWITAADLVELVALAGWRSGGSNSVRGSAMKSLGFRQTMATVDGKRAKIWVRGAAENGADVVRSGVRYKVATDSAGRVRAALQAPVPIASGPPSMPPSR